MRFAVALVLFGLYAPLHAQQPPYPPSPVIKSAHWDAAATVTFGLGSDQWPMTWGADGALYSAWGDGKGWTVKDGKKSIGVTRITGTPPDLQGEDLWGAGPGRGFAKPEALIALDNALYMFWTNAESRNDKHNTCAATSRDSGKTWALDTLRAFPDLPDGFRVRGICQFGPGYQDARDGRVYVYFGFNRHPDIYLARTPVSKLFAPADYEWFQRIGKNGDAVWTSHFDRKQPVFHDSNAYVWHIGVSYDPGLRRYLLTKPHYASGDDRDTPVVGKSGIASLGVFDAPAPWGPWTTVYYKDDFVDKHVKFSYFIPTKFIDKTGTRFWLAWSGWPEHDSVNFTPGIFILK